MGAPRRRGRPSEKPAAPKASSSSSTSAGAFFGGGGYASHGAYMVEKNRKLKEQLAAVAGETEVPRIFKGLTFWMTGRTCVPDQELKRAIVEHGGIYEQYGFTRVSHIIADNLATGNQTWRELRNRVRRGHVVTSRWVLDCVEAGRRLSEARYLPECLSAGSSMLSFVGANASKPTLHSADAGAASCAADDVSDIAALSTQEDGEPAEVSLQASAADFEKLSTPSGRHIFRDPPDALRSAVHRIVNSPPEPAFHAASSSRAAPCEDSEGALDREGAQAAGDCEELSTSPASGALQDCVARVASTEASSAQIALEVNAFCPEGLSSRTEILALLQELSTSAATQLHDHSGCLLASVGLRVTMEPLEEWCGFSDLRHPKAVGQGAPRAHGAKEALRCQDSRAVVIDLVYSELETIFRRASIALSIAEASGSGHTAGSSSLRRLSVQLSLHELPRTSALEEGSLLLGHALVSTGTQRPDVGVACKRRRRWHSGVLNAQASAHEVLNTQAPATQNEAGACRRVGFDDFSDAHDGVGHKVAGDFSTSAAMSGLPSPIAVAKEDALRNTPIEAVGSPRGYRAECGFIEASPTQPSVQDLSTQPGVALTAGVLSSAHQLVHAARSSCSAAVVLDLAEELRLRCSAARCKPAAAFNLLQMAKRAACPQGFQDYAAAVWSFHGRREFDIAVVALRMLRASIEARGEEDSQKSDMQTTIEYFNALLTQLCEALALATQGARLDVNPLPEYLDRATERRERASR